MSPIIVFAIVVYCIVFFASFICYSFAWSEARHNMKTYDTALGAESQRTALSIKLSRRYLDTTNNLIMIPPVWPFFFGLYIFNSISTFIANELNLRAQVKEDENANRNAE